MKRHIITLSALAGSISPAFAEVSDDLKFCGALKSGAERLACYDAAARIASRPAQSRPVARIAPLDAQAAAPSKAPALAPVRNPFDGYYAAIGGGYGVGSGRDAIISGPFTISSIPITSISGPNASVVAGRNIAIGWGIVGVEVDARWSRERGASAASPTSSFLYLGAPLLSYSYNNDAGIHASIRVGATFDDLLIFAKAGLGANRINESFTADERNVRQCFAGLSICGVLGTQGSLNAVQTTSWLPSAVFGVGVEKNWGPVFARLNADLEAFNHATSFAAALGVSGSSTASQIMWTTRGTAMIGFRF
jgi:hypothetical protein